MWTASCKREKYGDEVKQVKAVYQTDRGKVRPHNEDRGGTFYNESKECLSVVADGMGGHNAGDVASEMALEKLKKLWEPTKEILTPEAAEQWLLENIALINDEIYAHSKSHKECEGMGTTIVAAICTESFATVAHIGDSRCYILNERGFHQLTEDHSLVNELVRSGEISKEDAEHHPRKNVLLRALGTEVSVIADIKTITFEDGDLLLLCSDGLSNKVSAQEMQKILMKETILKEKTTELVKLANDNGGEDNITVIIVKNEDENELGDVSC